jgi:DNA-binding MurR/RpiR family transcriptional regulator
MQEGTFGQVMASRLTLRIQERFARLTASEQKLARLIMEQQDDILTHSATELAAMADVSKATTARFFRNLGYADFNEVRLQAREERNRTEPYRYSLGGSERIALGRAIGSHLELEIANVTKTFEELGSDKLTAAAEMIADAPRVWFLGFGMEEGLARYGRLLMARLRHNVMILGMNGGNAWTEDLAMTGPRDALVLITLEPRPRILRPILSYARTTRVNIITITDRNHMLQAQRYSNIVLPCHVTSFGLGPSYTATASIVRLLAVAYAAHAGDPALQRLDIINSIHEELDDTE